MEVVLSYCIVTCWVGLGEFVDLVVDCLGGEDYDDGRECLVFCICTSKAYPMGDEGVKCVSVLDVDDDGSDRGSR